MEKSVLFIKHHPYTPSSPPIHAANPLCQKACFLINSPYNCLHHPLTSCSPLSKSVLFDKPPYITPTARHPPKPSRSLLAAFSIAASNSPAKTADLITSNTPTKSFSAPTSTACLPLASSSTFVP